MDYILKQLLNFNKEFKDKYHQFVAEKKIVKFTYFEPLFFRTACSIDYKFNLQNLFKYDINLMNPYLTSLHLIKAIKNEKILDEVIDKKPTLVYGKQYLTKNFPNFYDCLSMWIETDKYIIDPVLCIVVDKSIKSEMYYKSIFEDKNYRCDALFFRENMSDMSGYKKYTNYHYYKYFNHYQAPKTLDELKEDKYQNETHYLDARKYIKNTNKNLYQRIKWLIKINVFKDLTMNMSEYDNIKVCEKYNPDLTLGQLLKKGLNFGRCGLFAKIFSTKVYDDENQTYVNGECKCLKGSRNCNNGNHAWLIINDKIIDTSLMLEIPVQYADMFGYKEYDKEKCTQEQNWVLGKKIDLEANIHFFDLMHEYMQGECTLFPCDFARFLPNIINNDAKCTFHYNNETTKAFELYDNECEYIEDKTAL